MTTYKHAHPAGYIYHAPHKHSLAGALKAAHKQLENLARSLCNRFEMTIAAALLSARNKR